MEVRGYANLLTTFGESPEAATINVRYLVIRAMSSYNAIIDGLVINKLRAIVSIPHLTMKFSTANGQICSVRANQRAAWQCYADSLNVEKRKKKMFHGPSGHVNRDSSAGQCHSMELDPRGDSFPRPQPEEDLKLV